MPAPVVDAEVVSPDAGANATPVYPTARGLLGRIGTSPQASWFAWGVIAGAVLVGVFVWKTRDKKRE